jgi:uncharacterized protein YbjT (DUF2867 family)
MADGDLLAGDGLAGAAAGVGAVVHCGSDPRRPCVEVDGTRNLIQAVQAAGTPHLVYVSIVGIDRVPYRYYRAKLEAERLIQASGRAGPADCGRSGADAAAGQVGRPGHP